MLTVLFATLNGSRTLPRVLQAYTGLVAPSSGWKLVVVDNGSTDDTRDIIQSFQGKLPLTYMLEPKMGKNAALNNGLSQLDGDLAVFTDDDAFPNADWLIRLRNAADDHPSYSMFGGIVLPRWQVPPPEWLSYVPPEPFFSLTDPALREGPTEAGNLFGPNMAIRAEVFRKGTRFDESIGPCGKSYAMGSETELVQRLARQGHKAWHVEGAVVDHFIREYQMEKSWLLSRAIRHGRGQFRLSQSEQPAALPRWPALTAYVVPRMCRRIVRMVGAWLTSNQRELFTAHQELNYNWGLMIEAHRMHRCRAVNSESHALE
jgi:glycosyltransferase involved in cell wall biosynthesis